MTKKQPNPNNQPKPDAPFDASMFDVSGIPVPPKFSELVQAVPVDPDEAALLANPPVSDKAESLAAWSERTRNAITQPLKTEWPAAYEHYRKLEQRKLAYEFAFRAFLALSYKKSNA